MFSNEEIKTAETVKNEILNKDVPDVLKATYMAGEIMMDKEYRSYLDFVSAQIQQRAEKETSFPEMCYPNGLMEAQCRKKYIEGAKWVIQEINNLASNK